MISHPAGTLMRVQQIAARDDRAGVRRVLDSLAQTRTGMRPGGVSLDYTIQEAWLADFAGDARAAPPTGSTSRSPPCRRSRRSSSPSP
jgi:hypothetical protein